MSPPLSPFGIPTPPTGKSDSTRFTPQTVTVMVIAVLLFLGGVIWAMIAYDYQGSTPVIVVIVGFAAVIILHVLGVQKQEETKAAVIQKQEETKAAVVEGVRIGVVAANKADRAAERVEKVLNGGGIEKLDGKLNQAINLTEKIILPEDGPLPPSVENLVRQIVKTCCDEHEKRETHRRTR